MAGAGSQGAGAVTWRISKVALLATLVAACTTGRHTAPATVGSTLSQTEQSAIRFSDVTTQNGDIEFEVERTLLPGDKAYFPKNNAYVEYAVRISNITPGRVEVQTIQIVGPNGIFRSPARHGMHLANPPDYSGNAGRTLALGTGGMLAGMLIPGAGIVAGTMIAMEPMRSADERTAYYKAFETRAFPLPVALDQEANASGSVFFPPLKEPRAFVVTYAVGQETRTLRMPLSR